jgi:hypothetical protein
MEYPFIARIALALHDEQGSLYPGKIAYVIEPVEKWAVSERNASFFVAGSSFKVRRPEQEKDGLSLKEERV